MATNFPRKVSRFFKKLGLVGYSKKKNIFGIHPLFISTFYIILILLLANLLRKLINFFITSENVYKQMLLEFVATLELCGACFELIIVADNWGIGAYALFLFALTIWWSNIWDTCSACPYNPIEEILEGTSDYSQAALLIFSQLLGAIVTFRYIQILWAMELVETHRGRAFQHCTADLQVHFVIGALIEAVATCTCRIISRILAAINARFSTIMDAFFATALVVMAFNYSGGYFNPALATSLKLGCEGNTFMEHLVVYWLGATIGSVLSIFIVRLEVTQNLIRNLKEKIE